MKIKTRGAQTFNVPNDSEGQEFLRLLKKFRNRGWHYRARGRGKRHDGMRQTCLHADANWFAVYLDGSEAEELFQQRMDEAYKAQAPIQAVGNFVQVLEIEVAEWSAPIEVASRIGVDGEGRAFNADVHGGEPMGVALEQHNGSIGEGEAEVKVQLSGPFLMYEE